MNSKVLLGFIVVVLGVGIGWYVLKGQQTTDQGMMKNKENPSDQTAGTAPGAGETELQPTTAPVGTSAP